MRARALAPGSVGLHAPAGCGHPVSAAGRGVQFTSIPRAELTGLAAYVSERRLPVGSADVAAVAAARAHGALRGPAGEDDEDSEEVRAPACVTSRSTKAPQCMRSCMLDRCMCRLHEGAASGGAAAGLGRVANALVQSEDAQQRHRWSGCRSRCVEVHVDEARRTQTSIQTPAAGAQTAGAMPAGHAPPRNRHPVAAL